MRKTARFSKSACYQPYSGYQSFIIVLALIGISTVLGLMVMGLIFLAERLGTTPYLALYYIEGLSPGENYILFIMSFILGLFFMALILWGIYRHYKKRHCRYMDTALNQI